MKILFVGDYSNLHATLASELKRRGHEAVILSDKGGYIGSHADIYLKRESGILGASRYLYRLFNLLPGLNGYDIVQFINPNFLQLRPGKIKYFFDRLKEQNGKMFLTMAGNDYFYCKACLDDKLFRFSEFRTHNKFTEFHLSNPNHLYGWTSYVNRNWNSYFYDKIDGAMSVLPEYDIVARQIIPEKTVFTNLPIDFSMLPEPSYDYSLPVKILIGIRSGMVIQKGANILKKIALEIEKEMPEKVKVEIVSDLPLNEFLNRINSSHIVLDQLYAYSPATTALLSMALGKVVGTGAQPEYYDYIGNPEERPILSLSPVDTDIKERIINLVENIEEIKKKGTESIKLVSENNDVKKVADKFLAHWSSSFE